MIIVKKVIKQHSDKILVMSDKLFDVGDDKIKRLFLCNRKVLRF